MVDKVKYLMWRPWTRHSLVLAVAGLVYIGVGISINYYIVNGPRYNALIIARNIMPLDYWSILWIVIGFSILIASRWPPYFPDTWGYVILTGFSAGWGGFYGVGMFYVDVPLSNLSTALVWWLAAFLWWVISGLLNPQGAKTAGSHGRR